MMLGSFGVGLCLVQSASTWRTPREWEGLGEAAREVARIAPAGRMVVAPEALLYYSERAGYRLEFDGPAARRAAGEWGSSWSDDPSPLALTELYARLHAQPPPRARDPDRWVGTTYWSPPPLVVADVGPAGGSPARLAWRAALRARPRTKLVVDRPDLIIAELLAEDDEPSR